MQELFISLSKYVFTVLITLYTLSAYRGATMHKESSRQRIYVEQNVLMFVMHLLGYLILYILINDINYVFLYFAQFVFLFVIIMIYDVLYPKASRLLVNNICTLMAIGFVILARLDFDKCVRQFIIAAVGTIITFFVPWLLKKFKGFRNLGWVYGIVGFVLLVCVLFTTRIFGANLVLTIAGISVQPSEFVKILYVLFIASFFNQTTTFKQTLLVTLFAGAHIVVLIISNDLGTALIFFVVYLMMLFIATRRITYLILGTGAGAGASWLAYKLVAHVRSRVVVWQNPWDYITGSGYQICQSLFAIGAGSWFGSGLYQGMPERIPVAEKDMIFAAISEEMGIVFAIALLLICLNNLILMMNIASRCNTLFYRLVAVGLGVTYGFQVFLTVGGAINLIPLTGVTLPFVSYGGSSIISSLFMFALINGMYNMRQDEGEHENEGTKKKAKQKSR